MSRSVLVLKTPNGEVDPTSAADSFSPLSSRGIRIWSIILPGVRLQGHLPALPIQPAALLAALQPRH